MRIATFQGIRGGVGTTSISALVAEALHQQGEHVLIIDANPSDMLRLFFNVPQGDALGWASALHQSRPWHEAAYQIEANFDLLPYGRNGIASSASTQDTSRHAVFWNTALDRLSDTFSWLVFDLPFGAPDYERLQVRADLDIRIARPDAGCHILLSQTPLPETSRLLASMYDPSRQLEGGILLDWRHRYAQQMVPFPIHLDEAIHEALAQKTTVQLSSPDSMGSSDAHTLATWFRTQSRRLP